ncbi:MAG: leucine-rich repeat domain-containing protein [Phycisphaerae bacterium]|nr:leucine-rich repeat domain-containing protein [Phycisphaerae bacterium]
MTRLLLSSILLLGWVGLGQAETPVTFSDARLKELVEEELWVHDPTPSDMLGLIGLTANSQNITSLTGLEHAKNLVTLEMTHNRVSSLSPLAGLPNLSVIVFNTNEISDLSPLSGLKSLTIANLHANRISDVSPLAGLPNLHTLILRVNQISEISSLTDLPSLKTLHLEDNQISSLEGISRLSNLRELQVGFNRISDLSPVCGLKNLSYLDVHNNQVRDISCLTRLTSLRRLDLRNNPLNQSAYDEYLPQIQANNPGIYIERDSHAGHVLRVTSTAGGAVIDPGEGEFGYDYNAAVRLEAKADPGFKFAGWSGSYSSTQNPMFVTLTSDASVRATFVSLWTEIYVDDDAPGDPKPFDSQASDPLENGTFLHPFDRIQEALDVAADGTSIIVAPGVYRENIDLLGKKVYLTAIDLQNPHGGPCAVIEGQGNGPVVRIRPGSGDKCSLVGFVITKGTGYPAGAIDCTGASPTLANCLIVGNRCLDSGGAALRFENSQAVLIHCTIADNDAGFEGAALTLIDSNITMTNSILWGNSPQEIAKTIASKPLIRYCAVRGWWPDLGNLHADPLFAVRGVWVNRDKPEETLDSQNVRAIWTGGDYHLKSLAGRWDPVAGTWISDALTSPCIDSGDPQSPIAHEPMPHGNIVNMGAYGGTTEASKSPADPRL